MQRLQPTSGSDEAVILVKAIPRVGSRHGETVCCAGINRKGEWLRLYPVAFRRLEDQQKFGRWDLVQFDWRLPGDDARVESRRIVPDSISIVRRITKPSERANLIEPAIVTSLVRERGRNRSLALLRPEIIGFQIVRKSADEIDTERADNTRVHDQADMFARSLVPLDPCPYRFRYAYRDDDGQHEGTCQDWETEATYFRWAKDYGEARALALIEERFGGEYPRDGMLLAMGTHSRRPDQWLINGVVKYRPPSQMSLDV